MISKDWGQNIILKLSTFISLNPNIILSDCFLYDRTPYFVQTVALEDEVFMDWPGVQYWKISHYQIHLAPALLFLNLTLNTVSLCC